ncbi:MAG TPA: glycosyltransferase family 39 protein [Longilinea sp.]|nr:glycosyltransferase family 39 protein [Longilinea sp.]
MTKKRQRVYLLAILAVSVVCRCIALGNRGIQYDDAFSFFLAIRSLPEIVSGTAADTMPPLYYFLLHFWLAISRELWFLRLLSVILTLFSSFILFKLVSELAGAKAGLWAVLFAAFSPLQIYHAQDLRMYALLEFFQLGYAFCLIKAWKPEQSVGKNALGWWIGAIFFAVGAMYTHNLAIFGLVAADIYLLFKRNWRLLGKLILAQVAIALFSLPWLIMIPGQLEKVQRAFWTPRPGVVEVVQAFLMWFMNLPLSGFWMVLAAVLGIQAFVLVLFELYRARKIWKEPGYLVAWAFVPPVLLFVISYFTRPVFVPRGFLVSSMAFYGLAGIVVAKRGLIGKWIAGTILLAALVSLPFFYTFAEFPRSPFYQATIALKQDLQPDGVIIHDNKLSYFPSHFYAPELPQHFLADEPGSFNDTYAIPSQQAMQLIPDANLETAIGGANEVFFVVFTQAIEEYRSAGRQNHPAMVWLDSHFIQTDLMEFNDLQVIRYER